MRTFFVSSSAAVVGALVLLACSAGSGNGGFGNDDGGGGNGDASVTGDDGGNNGDVGSLGDGNHGDGGVVTVTETIYANTDTELYSMDPMTHAVKVIGPFQGVGGGTGDTAVTDVAVNGNNEVWANTETVIYQATLPAGGTGPVTLTKKAKITVGSGQKFYALAFTPAGVLGAAEALVGGDNKGNLYYIDATTGAPQDLGGFGNDPMGNPWQLSGDVVFYTQNGANLGLATIRSCPNNRCSLTNDYLAEVDVAAMTAAFTNHTNTAPLLKKVYGTGTTFGSLFGVGAWGDKVFAFSRVKGGDAGAPAQLVQIDGTGVGTSLQTFAGITAGWSGAGVSTKATITVPMPR